MVKRIFESLKGTGFFCCVISVEESIGGERLRGSVSPELIEDDQLMMRGRKINLWIFVYCDEMMRGGINELPRVVQFTEPPERFHQGENYGGFDEVVLMSWPGRILSDLSAMLELKCDLLMIVKCLNAY
ncbi:hypothetical protein COLO4_36921 [Corchorus olitorius]|uniref:Uncharacterized protein n=1 Tax=Corchorus olitorius TaxID=93759 RepID=A0A1R3G474_9ROSI|nr:hypothetical protein COLO4_36921 [Corchorus olitorius]